LIIEGIDGIFSLFNMKKKAPKGYLIPPEPFLWAPSGKSIS
jgi:hypothetical protein